MKAEIPMIYFSRNNSLKMTYPFCEIVFYFLLKKKKSQLCIQRKRKIKNTVTSLSNNKILKIV